MFNKREDDKNTFCCNAIAKTFDASPSKLAPTDSAQGLFLCERVIKKLMNT